MRDKSKINAFLQKELRGRQLREVTAVEAAAWLEAEGLLKDSGGRNLRGMLRKREIVGGEQRPDQRNGNWFILRV